MFSLIITIHVIASIFMVLVILLQTGKGTDMGTAFGGSSSQSVFGGSGGVDFFTKLTTVVAVIFMATSIILTYMNAQKVNKSVFDSFIPKTKTEQPVDKKPVPPKDNTKPKPK